MSAKRILLVTEEWAGSGHRMAAEALAEALIELRPTAYVKVVSGLQTASPALREISRFFYLHMLRYNPGLWQKMHRNDKKWAAVLNKPLAVWLSRRMVRELIDRERPDVVVATHAYCFSALAEAKRKGAKPYQLVGVPTDFCVHRFWIHPETDAYVVAHEQLADPIRADRRLERTPVLEYGIPIRRTFQSSALQDKASWKDQLGLGPQQFTVLISGGEGGYGSMEEVIRVLMREPEPLQIVVITGKNHSLQEKLVRLTSSCPPVHNVIVRGYEPEIWKWMSAADVFLTKPGGISIAEALAVQTPLVLFQPLPGQEWRNLSFLLKHEAAFYARTTDEISQIVRQLRYSPAERKDVSQRMASLSKPNSAEQIAKYLLQL
ncbi:MULTISPECIES: MGDG synthase family glycosyltransferase [Brevibacillus]|uniref:MGDG synthase family glycosyltransferase n=1 Tax=Brevibacillus TaxID=55080 RepID=UPI0004691625|nr:glycosyltransferase [Brevibacillus borstelensis]KKX52718.1 glycosyl transferase [Brevibacillus borstelensis cifa_chp40]MBE5395637.1 glycosyl transferase [Brevibacillus borstelensis]MCC0567444.1 glycosyl transferase [Brevibacillus borstelensis]MCM3473616.1 glycosyl transferase [Brevibacillus borstelensis]MCM3561882.1 glycosyl transferase [Brevibacillus borstelensis]